MGFKRRCRERFIGIYEVIEQAWNNKNNNIITSTKTTSTTIINNNNNNKSNYKTFDSHFYFLQGL